MQTIDKSVALSRGLLPCCIFMSCLGKSGMIFNQSHREGWREKCRLRCAGWRAPPHLYPPPSSHPASHHPTGRNMHHSLDLAHICVDAAGSGRSVCVCVCVCVCRCVRACFKGPWINWGATWSYQMFSFHMCIAHQKQQPVPLLGPLLSSKASQPICFLAARPSALWVLAISVLNICSEFAVSNPFLCVCLKRERRCQRIVVNDNLPVGLNWNTVEETCVFHWTSQVLTYIFHSLRYCWKQSFENDIRWRKKNRLNIIQCLSANRVVAALCNVYISPSGDVELHFGDLFFTFRRQAQ